VNQCSQQTGEVPLYAVSHGRIGVPRTQTRGAYSGCDRGQDTTPGSSRNPRYGAGARASDANRLELFPASFNRVEDLKEALKDIDVVYHLAASLRGSYAAQVANTVVGTENLFLAVREAEVTRIVLVSSFSVMGVSQTSVVDESVPLEPQPQWRDPYAFAKLRQEELAWRYIREHQLPIVIVRPGVIYGPGAPLLTSRIGLRLCGIFLHLGGRNEIPLTHVENCAEAVLRAGQVADIAGEVFNICDDEQPTAKEILKQYRRVVEKIPYLTIPYVLLRLIGSSTSYIP